MPNDDDDRTQIGALLERFRAGFAALDAETLIGLWDRLHPGIVYVAQEVAEPIRGWEQVEGYYRNLVTVHPADRVTEMRLEDCSIDIRDDRAYAFCCFHFEGEVDNRTEPFIADGRVTFVFDRTAEGWKVIHYHESAPPSHRG